MVSETPPQTPEAEAFIQRVLSLPPGSARLDEALRPSIDDESALRRLFATDKAHARLYDPYVGLVDVFAAPAALRTTRARIVSSPSDLSARYAMPLADAQRRADACGLEQRRRGGRVGARVSGAPARERGVSKRAMRKYFHSAAYPTSDVDLFLWGLTTEQAEKKIVQIYEAVRDSVPWDVTCVRTKHTISIHSQYPYRSVQIVLRLYSSPAEILAGFDIDAPCCLYDGTRVLANPRAIVASMRQCNTVDMTRRSPSYEVRLAKYAARGFEVSIPSLSREDIDPTIFERSIVRVTGLARLLVLEKLTSVESRDAFLQARRTLRGRPNANSAYSRRMKRKFKGDLKQDSSLVGMEMNDYDVASLHIPYGPGWDARRIDKLDLGMNSTFNPKNKGRRLHRHPAYFGTIEECMEDCCEHCPEPIDADERALQAEEDANYIRGRIAFIKEDPGRQTLSGSFNPIDVGEWSAQVYIGPTERFFGAIARGDQVLVQKMLADEAYDVQRRDHVGRSPLQFAIMCKQTRVACDLIDAGARMTARLVDGRTSLHLAAQFGLVEVLRKLLERSHENAKQVPSKAGEDKDATEAASGAEKQRMSSEDDWSSEEDDVSMEDEDDVDMEDEDEPVSGEEDEAASAKEKLATETGTADLPDDVTDEPDVFEIDVPDWDLGYTPLGHGIVAGSLEAVDELLKAGADINFVSQAKNRHGGQSLADLPLSLTIIPLESAQVCAIAEALIKAGASCSAADPDGWTIFHRAVAANRPNLVATFLRCDPNAKSAALDYPTVGYSGATVPLVTAVSKGYYAVVTVLVAYAAKMVPEEEVLHRAFSVSRYSYVSDKSANNPLEVALARHDDVFRLLVELGADYNVAVAYGKDRPDDRRTVVEWLQYAATQADVNIADMERQLSSDADLAEEDAARQGWAEFLVKDSYNQKVKAAKLAAGRTDVPWQERTRLEWVDAKGYYQDMASFLIERNAKTWAEVYPDLVSTAGEALGSGATSAQERRQRKLLKHGMTVDEKQSRYLLMTDLWGTSPVPAFQETLYDELFEAAFGGDNRKIEALCSKPDPAVGKSLLQVAVFVADGSNRYIRTGLTPVYAAIAGRKWETARLLMAIAAAQYKPNEAKARFSTSGMDIDDSDDSDNESDASDDTIEQDTINFIDIANRASPIRCKVHPTELINSGNRDPFSEAIDENDLTPELPIHLMALVIGQDRVEMLDELMRRTGRGIEHALMAHRDKLAEAEEEDVPAVNDKNRIYLGLNVHGKKRADLAKRNDPDADGSGSDSRAGVPLLWLAIQSGKTRTVEYLFSQPQAHWGGEARGDAAGLAGWTITSMGESPIVPALLNSELDILKSLFKMSPVLMKESLRQRLRFFGMDLLSLAVQLDCKPEMIDFLLAKGVTAVEKDSVRRWNIFHHVVNKDNDKLLVHLLEKLPRDMVTTLLAQPSHGRLNTPLHIAAKTASSKCVKALLEFSSAPELSRAEKTRLLLDAAPQSVLIENGVGETALEVASLKQLQSLIQHVESCVHGSRASGVQQATNSPVRFDVIPLKTELARLQGVADNLLGQGVLDRAIGDKILGFKKYTGDALIALKDSDVAEEETADPATTLVHVQDAQAKVSGPRELVHTVDVQASVQFSLAVKPSGDSDDEDDNNGYRYRRRVAKGKVDGGLEAEADDWEERAKRREMYIYSRLQPLLPSTTTMSVLALALSLAAAVSSTPLSTSPYYSAPQRTPLSLAPLSESHVYGTLNNSYIVVLKPGTPSAIMQNHFTFLQSAHEAAPLTDDTFAISHVYDHINGYAGRFSAPVVEHLRSLPEVDFIERDQIVRTQEVVTQRSAPWGLARISHRKKLGLGTFTRYAYEESGGEGVDVYVIDTGTIASTKYGVAKKANVIAVKVLGSNGSGSMSDVVGGVAFATEAATAKAEQAKAELKATGKTSHKGSVANMSLGGGKSTALDRAVDAAVDKGLHFAVAAGNDNRDACNYSPAAAVKAITVGASTSATSVLTSPTTVNVLTCSLRA
ncbi:unnamed protein product [Mycena citricolor]|uniref:Inhibitor I9 domain-containing protein n=1 Tax=Mycena citricolor TaxID=2018698 RepID=A0AAD2HVJ7_9AGAR|nr:unnamed protein product [Mycena citricolor]